MFLLAIFTGAWYNACVSAETSTMIERWQTSRLSAMMKVRRGVNLPGIVLYSGNKTLRFGNGFYAVPLAALGA